MPDAAWGVWRRLYVDEYTELRVLEIEKGGFSSPHVHHSKSNFFVVAKGKVTVRQWTDDGAEIAGTLTAHAVPLVVAPEVMHQFEAQEDSLVYELSVASPGETMDADEIERHGSSGIKQTEPPNPLREVREVTNETLWGRWKENVPKEQHG